MHNATVYSMIQWRGATRKVVEILTLNFGLRVTRQKLVSITLTANLNSVRSCLVIVKFRLVA